MQYILFGRYICVPYICLKVNTTPPLLILFSLALILVFFLLSFSQTQTQARTLNTGAHIVRNDARHAGEKTEYLLCGDPNDALLYISSFFLSPYFLWFLPLFFLLLFLLFRLHFFPFSFFPFRNPRPSLSRKQLVAPRS